MGLSLSAQDRDGEKGVRRERREERRRIGQRMRRDRDWESKWGRKDQVSRLFMGRCGFSGQSTLGKKVGELRGMGDHQIKWMISSGETLRE